MAAWAARPGEPIHRITRALPRRPYRGNRISATAHSGCQKWRQRPLGRKVGVVRRLLALIAVLVAAAFAGPALAVNPEADLSVTKTGSPAFVDPGDHIV